MWFIGFEVEQEMSAPPPKKNPGSALVCITIATSNGAVICADCLKRDNNGLFL